MCIRDSDSTNSAQSIGKGPGICAVMGGAGVTEVSCARSSTTTTSFTVRSHDASLEKTFILIAPEILCHILERIFFPFLNVLKNLLHCRSEKEFLFSSGLIRTGRAMALSMARYKGV